jgi:hypothetical protein
MLGGTLVLSLAVWGLSAQQPPPAQPKEQKREGRAKPENQPGKVMNAEELAKSHAGHHPVETLPGGGVLPPGWKGRFDLVSMQLEHLRFLTMDDGLHVTSGPPGIYYRPDQTATGSFTVKATFTQLAKGAHREGYGAFIGGADLDGDGQRYTYFLLRQDGHYLVKRRAGGNTQGVIDWTPNDAIKSFGANGRMTNEIGIDADAATVRFLVNGTEVASRPRSEVDADGVVGLRINHQLDLHVQGFGVAGR